MREEIRGKRGGEGEASPSAREGGKTEVTHRKTPQPQEERGDSEKVDGKLHTARGGSVALRYQWRVKVTSSINVDSLVRDKRGNAELGLGALSDHSCQSTVLFGCCAAPWEASV